MQMINSKIRANIRKINENNPKKKWTVKLATEWDYLLI